MSKMLCKCGNMICTVLFPNKIQGEIGGLFEWDHRNVWQCDDCAMLWVEVENEEGEKYCKSYIPENGEKVYLFQIQTAKKAVKCLKNNIKKYLDLLAEIAEGPV